MTITRERYRDMIENICENIQMNNSGDDMYNDLMERLDSITDSMIEFAEYFEKMIKIAKNKRLTNNEKVKELMKLKFKGNNLTKEQAKDILKKMKISKNENEIIIGEPISINIGEIPEYTYKGGAEIVDDIKRDMNGNRFSNIKDYAKSLKRDDEVSSVKSETIQELINEGEVMVDKDGNYVDTYGRKLDNEGRYIDKEQVNYYDAITTGIGNIGNNMREKISNFLPSFKNENIQNMVFRGVNTIYPVVKGEDVGPVKNRLGSFLKHIFFRLPMTLSLKLLHLLSGSRIEEIRVKDFDEPLPFIYFILFILSNVPIPIGGSIINFIASVYTIFQAIDDGRIYLALLSVISLILSLFVLYTYDLGVIFKLLYWLDVKHETEYKRQPEGIMNITPTKMWGGEKIQMKLMR